MSFPPRKAASVLAWFALSATALGAQYSTPVGKGAAKPKTLRATAVLEYTGPLDKPTASRLMPVAIWDGEHYQPAGLYLARPAPLALDSGTQYDLERSGESVGLFNVRAAAELNGAWVGLGRFQAEAPPPPPPKLKPSKKLPVLSGGKPDSPAGSASDTPGDHPTLHRKTDPASTASPAAGSSPAAPASAPTSAGSGTSSAGTTSTGTAPPAPDSSSAGSATPSASDSTAPGSAEKPTLHRRSDSSADAPADASAKPSGTDPGTDTDTDRPTLHKHRDAASADDDPDRPTLHRAKTGSDAEVSIDPDRPRLRYGSPDDSDAALLPKRLVGTPPDMKQVVAVSDTAPAENRPYQYHWTSPDEAAKMQATLATLAAQAIVQPSLSAARPAAQFGPAARAAAHKARQSKAAPPPAPALVDAKFAAYELTFSDGATLVYTAHTVDEGPGRVYVTLIAQPDFTGKPQILLRQVAHGDRLDETPAMQLVDAVDTDGDQRAELIFELTGAATLLSDNPTPTTPAYDGPGDSNAIRAAAEANAAATAAHASAQAATPEREFAIYRISGGKAVQVFDTGPLP